MILPLLFVPLVYGLSSTPDACAAPKDPKWDTGTCYNWEYSALRTCCWQEPDILNPGETIAWCQTCDSNGENCGSIFLERSPTGPLAPLEDGVLEQPEQPPLFGRNEGAVPPTGGILQPFAPAPAPGFQPLTPRPFTSTPFQQIPQGQVQPFIQSETPPTLSPTPTPPPPLPPPTQTGPTVAPQDSQDDEGGGLPATENQENVPLDGGAAEQPEDDGQEESSEGAETAGPLT
jgi:hypothetical protein